MPSPLALRLKAAYAKQSFVPGAAGGAPPVDPMMAGGGMPPMPGGMGMPPMGGGGMPPAPPMDPSMMGGAPPPPPPPGGAMPPEAMGVPPPGMEPPPPPSDSNPSDGQAEPRRDPETGQTLLPMEEVVELLGAVTGKRAPTKEPPMSPDAMNQDVSGGGGGPAAAGADAPPQSNPVTPLGGIDPSALG